MTNSEFILDIAERIKRLPTMFTQAEADHLTLLGKHFRTLDRHDMESEDPRDRSFRRGDPGHPDNEMGM